LEAHTGYWINDNWHKLPKKGDYRGIAVSGNDVCVYGYSDETAGYWFNDVWNILNTPDVSIKLFPEDVSIFDNDVYITGGYSDIYGKWKPCYWLNGILHSLAIPSDDVEYFAYFIAFATE